MQSLNEELNAVNSELEHKVAQLDETGDDLRNLLAGNEIATIFLDDQTRIKWFTPPVTRLFDVIDTDIGRPIANLAQKFIDGDLVGKAREAIDKLIQTEEQVHGENGRVYSLRVQPYRTRDNRIAGAVASFVDITELERSQSQAAEARDYAEAIVRTVRDPMIVLDGDLRVKMANPAFYRFFQVTAKTTEGQLFHELGNNQWNIPELRDLLENLLPTKGAVTGFAVERDFPHIGRRCMVLNAQRIAGYGTRPDLILLAFDDASERMEAERHREMLIGELSHRVKNSLAVVQSIAMQTFRNSETLADFGAAFNGRLQALGRAHDMVLKSGFQHIALGSIVDQALKPFMGNDRIEIGDGPSVGLGQVASQSLTLLLHELATNASKYGALSNGAGTVSIDWWIEAHAGKPRVSLLWTESGGPAVAKPERSGQGTRFIKGSVRYELRGEATLDFRPEGLRVQIDFPPGNATIAGERLVSEEPADG